MARQAAVAVGGIVRDEVEGAIRGAWALAHDAYEKFAARLDDAQVANVTM